MLIIIGTSLLAIGAVLVAVAYACHRHPAASRRLVRWVGGETAGVLLTLFPATGLVALFNVVVGEKARDITILHLVTAVGIAAFGWFITQAVIRRATHWEAAEAVKIDGLVKASAAASIPSHPTPAAVPEKRAA